MVRILVDGCVYELVFVTPHYGVANRYVERSNQGSEVRYFLIESCCYWLVYRSMEAA